MTDPSMATPVVEGVEWVRPRPARAAYRNDLVLALVLAAATAGSVVLYRITGWGEDAPWWGSVIWVAAMNLPLAARRRWPEIVALVTSVAFIIGGIAEVGDALFSNIALFIAIYTVGAWGPSRLRANIVRGVIIAGMFAWLFWGLIVGSLIPDQLPEMSRDGVVSPYLAFGLINVITNLLYFGGAWYFGDSAYRSARSRAELEQRTGELAAERERTRAQAVAIERLRIARELHDVVAHHVSVIGVQAGAARRVIAKDPDAATASLSAIESSAREAVDELHGLLGTLRSSDGGAADASLDRPDDIEAATTSTSTRGLERIDDLVAESVAAGLPTTLAIVGEPRDASPLIGLSVYRIAQEALTNVRKHGGAAATADVRLRWSDDAVELEVANTGAGGSGSAVGTGSASNARLAGGAGSASGTGSAGGTGSASGEERGLGQLGMRERVAAAGGTLELGPRARGGYLVRARFPLRRSETVRA